MPAMVDPADVERSRLARPSERGSEQWLQPRLRHPERRSDLSNRPLSEVLAELIEAEREIVTLLEKLASAVSPPDMGIDANEAAGQTIALKTVLTECIETVPVEPGKTYRVAGIYSFGRGMFERAEIDGSATSYRVLNRLRHGQVVMSRLKAWEGAIAVVPKAFDGWFLSPEFPTFSVDAQRVDIDFLGTLLTSEQFWSGLAKKSRGIGARRERVHASRLLEQEIDLPPLDTQRAIAQAIEIIRDIAIGRNRAGRQFDALLPAALNTRFGGFS